jgi:hypothetical protein
VGHPEIVMWKGPRWTRAFLCLDENWLVGEGGGSGGFYAVAPVALDEVDDADY